MSHTHILLAIAALSLASASSAELSNYSLLDSRILLQGRYLATPGHTILADIELFSLSFAVSNASAILLQLRDGTAGGARLAVTLDTRVNTTATAWQDPNPSGSAMPGLRVATLLTSPHVPLYNLGSGGQVRGLTLLVTVTLLSEWEMIGGEPGSALEFLGISTDGQLLGPPAAPLRPTRRLAVLGDSLSSGVGCGFDTSPGVPCGAGIAQDDASATWGALLCAHFGAECEVVAGSGITLMADASYNLPLVFPNALGAMARWPAGQRVRWDFAAHPVDAALVELGENDCHALNCSSPADLQRIAQGYVALVQQLGGYYGKALPIFLAIANHEAGQSQAMQLAIPQLAAQGFSVAFLNATAPDVLGNVSIDTGCAGHPSAAQQRYSAQRAQAVLAQALHW